VSYIGFAMSIFTSLLIYKTQKPCQAENGYFGIKTQFSSVQKSV